MNEQRRGPSMVEQLAKMREEVVEFADDIERILSEVKWAKDIAENPVKPEDVGRRQGRSDPTGATAHKLERIEKCRGELAKAERLFDIAVSTFHRKAEPAYKALGRIANIADNRPYERLESVQFETQHHTDAVEAKDRREGRGEGWGAA